MHGSMRALTKKKTKWKDKLYLGVKVAHQNQAI